MNYKLPYLPERDMKPRNAGITMMMDKGLSIREVEDIMQTSAEYIDLAKLGFGTALITKDVEKKIKLYKDGGVKPYFGGTLFEAFAARNMVDDYLRFVEKYQIEIVEISDGCMKMDPKKKLEYIKTISKNFTVLSEVGSKEAGILISPARWIKMMETELAAGAWKVIAEARESGNVGIYRPNGNAHVTLVNKILAKINQDDIIWETPLKAQAVWFVKMLGANVNVGNIASNEVISTETIRLGLRGDTFLNFMPEEMQERLRQE